MLPLFPNQSQGGTGGVSEPLNVKKFTAVTNNNDNHIFLILEAEAEAEAIDESRVFHLLVFQ